MNIQDALKETGKAKRDMWEEKEYIHKEGMYFVDNEGKPFNREDVAEDVWQPYHEVKEIRPEKAGELWKCCSDLYAIGKDEKGLFCHCLTILDISEDRDLEFMIHGKCGFERLFSPVEDESVERREFINVNALTFYEGDKLNGSELVAGQRVKMILEIPKETP